MGEDLVLAHQRCRGVLDEHHPAVQAGLLGEEVRQPGEAAVDQQRGASFADRGELAEGDLGEVERDCHGLAMEVAPRDDAPAACRQRRRICGVAGREDEWVVRGRVDLDLEHAAEVVDRVAYRAVDLGHTAERVRVLDLVRRAVMRADELRIAQEVAQLRRHGGLAGMGTGGLVRGGERDVRAERRLDAHRRDRARRPKEPFRVVEHECPDGAHHLCPVQQREPLLRLETEWLELRFPEDVRGGSDATVRFDPASADQREGEVRERGEVARCAHGALRRHDRVDVQPQEIEQPLDDRHPTTGVAEGEGVGAQEEHRPDDLAIERRSDADGMTDEEVRLEAAALLGRDRARCEVAEPGRDAVHDVAGCDELFDHGAARLHPSDGLGGEGEGRACG